MIDWKSAEVQGLCIYIGNQIAILFLGSYMWHIMLTVPDVEYAIITRRFKFRWVPFLYARYGILIALPMLITVLNEWASGNCIAIYKIVAIAGNGAQAAASTSLLLRALTLWKDNKYVPPLLIILALGHWSLAFSLAFTGSRVSLVGSNSSPCGIRYVPPHTEVIAFALYCVLHDLNILTFTVWGLLRQYNARSSPLWSMLYAQGVGYATITLMANLPVVVLAWLNLNDAMNLMLTPPAGVISVVASGAAVRGLFKMQEARSNIAPPAQGNFIACTELAPANALTTHINLTPSAFVASGSVGTSHTDLEEKLPALSAFGTGFDIEAQPQEV